MPQKYDLKNCLKFYPELNSLSSRAALAHSLITTAILK